MSIKTKNKRLVDRKERHVGDSDWSGYSGSRAARLLWNYFMFREARRQ